MIALADSLANAMGYSVHTSTTLMVEIEPEEIVGNILRPACTGISPQELLETFHREMDVIRGASRTLRP